jgi:serine/threonine protein kinase
MVSIPHASSIDITDEDCTVFLGENNSVKLGDFGLSKIIASHDFASTYVGTPFYMSPEICAAERYSHHSDIWSLGCIIYELASRQVPFEARSHMELVLKIKNGRIKPLPSQYSQDLTDAISWCLKTDPRQRPDCAQLLSFANIKVARTRLEQATALGQMDKVVRERDLVNSKLTAAQKLIQDLQAEVAKLREANKKVEMEWHARATLAIDQKVQEASDKHRVQLLAQFEAAIEQRAEEKLALHLASLPTSHSDSKPAADAASAHIRSSTPPPGNKLTTAAFANFSSKLPETDASSLPEVLEDSLLIDTELTSLSLHDTLPEEEEFQASPLANRRQKPPPKKSVRKPFTRAKTLANCNFNVRDSPMDVHMASPSPYKERSSDAYSSRDPYSSKALGLSPRRGGGGGGNVADLRSEMPLKRNIFSQAAEKENRAPVKGRSLVELHSRSPAKWRAEVHGEEMPSPFIKRR